MIELDEQVGVDRPRAAVYAQLARIEDLPTWLPVIKHAERLDPGDPIVGSRMRLVLSGFGSDITATGELTELRAPEVIAFRTLDAPARIAARCTLVEEAASRTAIRLTGTVELPGFLRFVEGTARDRIRREAPGVLADLKARLESAIPSDPAASG